MSYSPRIAILTGLAVALLAPSAGRAQFRHPRYLHARSDLRRAQLLMQVPEEPNVMRDMRVASDQIERAIHELDVAARFDRRDLDDRPPVDVRLGRGSRFREILRLLDSAKRDIASEEDNPLAREWRNRAFGYIDAATEMVRKGGYDKFRDETVAMPPAPLPPPRQAALPPPPPPPMAVHPRYLSALADLRYARALLYRPDWRDVMRDQRAAVDEIDRAIAEARAAAIDDGRNPDAHPPIEARMGWGGRFQKAMELLDSAQRDLSQAEDNRAAAAWRAGAIREIQNAKAFVAKAMRDSWWR
jgi:hypothetical protein